MTFRTAYCTDTTCRSIRIIQDSGDVIFSIPSPTDPTYLNLLFYGGVPFSYVPITQFFCDPRLLTRGKILTINEFLTQCDTVTGELLLSEPSTTEDWIVAYELNNSDNIVVYTTDNQKFTFDPVDDALLFTEVNNYSDFLFGGKILTEFEADLYNIDERFFNFVDFDEDTVIVIDIDIDDLAPFTLVNQEVSTQVDPGFTDFLQLSESIVNQYLNTFNTLPPKQPQLLRDTSFNYLWTKWLTDTNAEDYSIVRPKLQKDIDS